ncbi:MAG: phospho-sugar mutase [Cytophagaceae bacterium]|nr:phospho-sugar mutase [Cytophagaceae bacterium]MDW8455860.1 phospho-sugar mutase [Cytophagaceae bacterium]
MNSITNTTRLSSSAKARIEKWMQGAYDDETKSAIQKLIDEGKEDELNDCFYKELEFGTGGLRGIMGVGSNRMNKYTVGMATQGLCNYLKKNFPAQNIKVAIAHDSRNNSAYFAQITADVFSANNIKVYMFSELRPTPELSFAIRHFGCQSGVVITASHNPKEYNGYKAYWNDGAQVIAPHDKNIIEEVQKITSIEEVRFEANPALIEHIGHEVDEQYMKEIHHLSISKEAIARQKDLKIVFSPIHGTGITLVPSLLEKFGFTNVHIVDEQSNPDGNFPTVIYPNPEESEAMSLAMKKAEEIDADLVLATDPDADRVGIAVKNNEGKFQLLNGNQTGSLLVHYMLKVWKEKEKLTGREFIVKTIVTTNLIEKIAAHFKVKCYNTLTGFKYIAALIRELEGKEKFIVGGEESYGYLVGDVVRDKDAIASCAFIAEMVAYYKDKGISLYDALLDLYVEYGLYKEKLISITKKGQSGAEDIKNMMKQLRENPPATLGGSNLYKIYDYEISKETDLSEGTQRDISLPKENVLQFLTYDGSLVSARPSGTEPKIKFYFSVCEKLHHKADFEKASIALDKKIQTIIDELKLN